jgi:5'-nucleotidase
MRVLLHIILSRFLLLAIFMNTRFRFFPYFALVLLLSSCASAPPLNPVPVVEVNQSSLNVKIIAFNDFHGNLKTPNLTIRVPDATQPTGTRMEPAGGVEQMSALINTLKAKSPNFAVVSAGDMVGATPLLSALFQDEPTIEAMNLVGIDFHAVGNHEFDYGVEHLRRLQAGGCALNAKTNQADCGGREAERATFSGANFRFLAANVNVTATNKPLFPAYAIKEFEGVKVAFIGVVTRETPALVRPGGTAGVTFHDEVESVNALIPELKSQGAEAIVVMIHEGGVQTGGINECNEFSGALKAIVEKFDPAVDVVTSAHSHRSYVCDMAGKLVTSAGSNGTLLTEIDLVINRVSGKVEKKNAQNLIVSPNGPKDARLTELVAKYQKLAEPREKKVVGKVTREVSLAGDVAGESSLGNLVADAHLFATAAPDKGGAVIAFNNPGSLRAPIIPAEDGSVSYGALFTVQPFQNNLIVMTMTGKQIKDMLEQQTFTGAKPRLLGVSKGFSYSWDASKPVGEKVIAHSMKLNGMAMQMDLQYRIAANSFLAGGSEGMTAFRAGADRLTSDLDIEALVSYLAVFSPLTPPLVGGRLARLN